MSPLPLIVAITGASGVVYGIRALQRLKDMGVETHLVMTRHARATIAIESDRTVAEIKALATTCHSESDIGASIASGSFRTQGMLILPCSIRTLSGVANCADDNLVIRAADVQLKERRPVVLAVRETPLHAGHLRLMCEVTAMGGIIMPPVPAFYHRPTSVMEIVDHTVVRCLDLLGLSPDDVVRWNGRPTGDTLAFSRVP